MKLLLFIHLMLGNIQHQTDNLAVYFKPSVISIDSVLSLTDNRIDKVILERLVDKVKRKDDGILIQQFSQGLVATQSCLLDVYRWNGYEWENEYLFDNSGFNCGSIFFERDSVIYNHGGYGYWERHSKTIYLDSITSGWELVNTENIPRDYSAAFRSIVSDTLYNLFGIYVNQTIQRFDPLFDGGYYLDLNSKIWSRFYWKFYDKKVFSSGQIFEPCYQLNDYSVFTEHANGLSSFLVFSKIEKKLYLLEVYPGTLIEYTPFYYISGNRLKVIEEFRGLISFDLDKQKSDLKLIAEITFDEPFRISKRTQLLIIAIGVFGLLAVIIIAQQRRIYSLRSLSFNGVIKKNEVDILITKLKAYTGETLETDQLDKIFEISPLLTPEGIRGRRSRLINEINVRYQSLNGSDLIIRDRSNQDNRFFSYRIR